MARPPPDHAQTAEQVLAAHRVTPAGLESGEAVARRARWGSNALPAAASPSVLGRLGHQFASPLVLLLVAAAGLSALVGEVVDALVIGVILLANAMLGVLQELRADRALEALASMLQPTVRVRRDGSLRELEARVLVPGDVVELSGGDRIPADVRWIESAGLEVDESVLTGESVPVLKSCEPVPVDAPLHDRSSMGFQATDVVAGSAVAVVVGVGRHTAFGGVAALAESAASPPTPLQRQLTRVGRQLGLLAVGMSVAIGLGGWVVGQAGLDMLFTAVSLAVAAVPEGLPAVVTLTLAFGVRRLATRHVLSRRLEAAETMGAATVICTDKTGTLTEGKMMVREVWTPDQRLEVTGQGYEINGDFFGSDGAPAVLGPSAHRALQAGLDCNQAGLERGADGVVRAIGSPTEAALVVVATKAALTQAASTIVVPFDSRSKRMVVSVAGRRVMKGAPEIVLPLCALDTADRRGAEAVAAAWGGRGLRTLAVAEGDDGQATLLGLFGIFDPPRPEVAGAIASAHTAGIDVIIVTGDARTTARGIADQIGHTGQIIARATPEDKLRLVQRLQSEGHVVAMTGDGVNDAPALDQADVGIAMGIRGTDVARASADIVLTDDHFASIVGGIEEGRRQLDNIRKFVRYLLASNTGEVLAIGLNLLLGGPLLLLPVQILWMNLVTDGVTALALGLEPPEPDTMTRPPARPDASLLPTPALRTLAIAGAYLAVSSVFCFHVVWRATDDVALARTAAFTCLVVLEKVNVLNYRGLRTPLSRIGWLTNPWLLAAMGGTLLAQAVAVYAPPFQSWLHTAPLRSVDLGLIALLAVPVVVVPELVKTWRARAR